ncbi:MAG: outer membrane lipoprotein chaperone LolA [Paludibacterium sp.]|uniref:outer membrane lipoprotein chaperone LolA n=1 Tax=Paludibacterium sp. TaxID=1917523 RepID=UPI0025F393D2|nr:outer membrane lipoprotein chaperone LolA [Paludibacterium sp.]MBV8049477.1 outer membrane lipoprotein chaperone LolA [Paludibacterium sp.]MBV8647553.1 outer membrane lipoprotein chaperone LolA [Paludibacterium sp.]
MRKILCTVALLMLAPLAQADAIPQLKAFIASTSTLTADFQQVVTSKNKRSEASGTLSIARPGKFLWIYTKPYDQIIDGDGKRLWIYDKELAQVTTRPLNAALGSSPAALLAGSNAIERDYALRESGADKGLSWLTATPKKDENTFKSIRMGFSNNALQVMELSDTFGNLTRISFSNMKKNPALPATLFHFAPPKGADVISDQ